MTNEEKYLNLLNKVLTEGTQREDRTGVGTISMFGDQVRYDLREGFPLLTTKKIHFKSVKGELLWFLSGSTSSKELEDKYGVTIWKEWADENGNLGPVYGRQWRSWVTYIDNGYQYETDNDWYGISTEYTIDQIAVAIEKIKTDPNDRGNIVSAWNVTDLPDMALRPCHTMFQFYVDGDYLDLQLYQRSADMFLGVPFNIASYSLLLTMIAQVTGKTPRYFIHTLGDVHLYNNHVDQAKEQLSREPKAPPKIFLSPGVDNIDSFTMEDIVLLDYTPHLTIKGEVAV